MADAQYQNLYPEEFEMAALEAHGAVVGTCYGRGEDPPRLTATLKEAYERGFAVAFNRGVEVGRKATL